MTTTWQGSQHPGQQRCAALRTRLSALEAFHARPRSIRMLKQSFAVFAQACLHRSPYAMVGARGCKRLAASAAGPAYASAIALRGLQRAAQCRCRMLNRLFSTVELQ